MISPLSRYIRLWSELTRSYREISSFRWLIIGIGVGICAGLAAVVFHFGVEGGKFVFLKLVAGMDIPHPAGENLFEHAAGHGEHVSPLLGPWAIPIGTTLVGLVTGFLVNKFIPDAVNAGTDGTDAMIKAFHRQEGNIRARVPLIRGITSILTISTGGSAGVEGPISQIGAGVGSFLATKLGLSTKERRIMLLAGAAGGLGAIFRAPLGGALTAIEVIYKEDFEAEAILPAVLSSVVAYSIFTFFFGTQPIFAIPKFAFDHPAELPYYILLALVCTLTGWMYVRCFYTVKYSVFWRLKAKVGIMWTMALGGLLMGVFGMYYPYVLAGGYGWLEMAILGQMPAMLMLSIIFAKTLATSMTIGSGMSGGMFAPALFVGGMSGGLVGKLAAFYNPAEVAQPGGYVLVGMAAFFASVANAPIGPLIMVCELTQGYGLLAPLMLASAIALVLGRHFSLYENQVDNKFDSPAHTGDMTINVLEGLKVRDYYRPGRVTVLEPGTTLKALTDIIANSTDFYYPVRGEDGRIAGILDMRTVRQVLYERNLYDLIVVGDLAGLPATLHPDDDLYSALLACVKTDYGQIPVVDRQDETRVLGLLNREDVFKAYNETICELCQLDE